MALSANAGLKLQASLLLLPAATTTTTPALTAASMTVVYPGSAPFPPRLMLITAGLTPLTVTQSIALYCQDRDPDPWSLNVFTERTDASVATPKVAPAAVPAQCVPCPCLSAAQFKSPLHSTALPLVISRAELARLPNSRCVTRTPVS